MTSNKTRGIFIVELLVSISMFIVVLYEVVEYDSYALKMYGYKFVIPFILFCVFTIGSLKSLVDMVESEEKKRWVMHKFMIIVALVYLVVVYMLVLSGLRLSDFRPMPKEYWVQCGFQSVNFVPFKVFADMKSYTSVSSAMLQLFGNLVMLTPLGVILPVIWKRMRSIVAFAVFTALFIVLIESVQFVSQHGSCDIDDFILNMSGALLGYGMYKLPIVQKLLSKLYIL